MGSDLFPLFEHSFRCGRFVRCCRSCWRWGRAGSPDIPPLPAKAARQHGLSARRKPSTRPHSLRLASGTRACGGWVCRANPTSGCRAVPGGSPAAQKRPVLARHTADNTRAGSAWAVTAAREWVCDTLPDKQRVCRSISMAYGYRRLALHLSQRGWHPDYGCKES